MKSLLQTMLLFLVLFIAVSCDDDDGDKQTPVVPTGEMTFSLKGTSGSSSEGRTMSDLEITSATAAITKVELESESDSTDNDDLDTEVEYEGRYTVDILAGTSDPVFEVINVAAQKYNKLEVEFGNFLENDAALMVTGNYTNDNDETIPFEFSIDSEIEFELEREPFIEVNEGDFKELIATIDFSLLFEGIDFGLAETNGDGVVIINSSVNAYVFNLINKNFSSAIALEIEED